MAYTRTTWRTGETPLSAGNMNNIEDGIEEALAIVQSIAEVIYPVGCYFETSDTEFDPNVTFGGTWILEAAGLVHVSAGAGYAVNGANTNTKDGGSKDAVIPYHRHSVAAVSTTGGAVQSKTLDETSSGDFYYGTQTADTGGIIRTSISSKRMYDVSGTSTNSWARLRIVATHNHGFTNPSVPAHNTAYAGTSGNVTNANMPPYIIVNRWHRTA